MCKTKYRSMYTLEIEMPRLKFFDGRIKFLVHPQDIIRMEARSNYTFVYFTNHPPLLMAKVLRKYARILQPYGFIRTHRSHLVNAHHVLEITNQGNLQMKDQSTAEISRRKKGEVKQLFTTN